MIWTIIKILIFTLFLLILARQSYNYIFAIGRKPLLWVFFMFLLNFIFFLIGSKIQDSFNVIWFSSVLTFLLQLPPKKDKTNKDMSEAMEKINEELFKELGLKVDKKKYNLGLVAFILGGFIGWILFYNNLSF